MSEDKKLSEIPDTIQTLGSFMSQRIGDIAQWYGTWFSQENINGEVRGETISFIKLEKYKDLELQLALNQKKLDVAKGLIYNFRQELRQKLSAVEMGSERSYFRDQIEEALDKIENMKAGDA